jgi:hypothetical protein
MDDGVALQAAGWGLFIAWALPYRKFKMSAVHVNEYESMMASAGRSTPPR